MYNTSFKQKNKFTSNKLQIDCEAIANNYKIIKKFIGDKVTCAATIKADAYGLGVIPVMRCLSKAGCNRFFVTSLDEALELRKASITDEIYVLNGVYAGEEDEFVRHQIIPILNNKGQFELFNNYCRRKDKSFEAGININTGLNYIGFFADEAMELSRRGFFNQKVKLRFIISRLACSSQKDNDYNKKQLSVIKELKKELNLPISLADSEAIALGAEYHFNIVKPGIMLYGVESSLVNLSLKPAISLVSSIVQINEAREDLLIGYDNVGKVSKGSVLATIPIGYADGMMRSICNKAIFYINGEPAPVVGNVSMDLMTLDVTKVNSNYLHLGAEVEILGSNSTVETLAKSANTSAHEIITALGTRLQRLYINF